MPRGVCTRSRLSVSDGLNQTAAPPIVIQVGVPPSLTVAAPIDGALYRAGDTVNYSASAVDSAGRTLADSAFTTEVLLPPRHACPSLPWARSPVEPVRSPFPRLERQSADTWYEVIVTATDAGRPSTTKSVNIHPRKSHVTLHIRSAGARAAARRRAYQHPVHDRRSRRIPAGDRRATHRGRPERRPSTTSRAGLMARPSGM